MYAHVEVDAQVARLEGEAAKLRKRAAAAVEVEAAAARAAAARAAAAAARPKPKAANNRRNRQAPVGGFTSRDSPPQPTLPPPQPTSSSDDDTGEDDAGDGLEHLAGYDASLDGAVEAYIKQRYGSKHGEVLTRLWLWEAYDEVYRAWRDEWTSDTQEYRGERALRMLRAGINFVKALNVVSLNQHQSWYVHYLIYIVPRQLYKYGNTWRFSTAPIESRGARIKRIARRVVSWRARAVGTTAYDYIRRSDGVRVQRAQRYDSSPCHQMLQKVCMSEDFWHSSSTFSRPEHLRLQLHARATRIKLEPTSNESSDAHQHMLSVLRAAVSDPPQPNMTSPQPTSAL